MRNDNNNNSALQAVATAGIATIAAASKTPFLTAFKITIGIGLASALMSLLTIAGCAASFGAVIYLVK